ncbi:hypothetical protein, partial [Acetobacter persici]|uniref:hypothetical protein n=1 Tax=Acetobacter persici TaxID=1076596 RepID=UPI001BAD20A0
MTKFAVNLAAKDHEPLKKREIVAATAQQLREQKTLDAMKGKRIEDIAGRMRCTHGFAHATDAVTTRRLESAPSHYRCRTSE